MLLSLQRLIPLFFSVGGLPAISVSPSSWDFGSTPVDTPVEKEFTIQNTGTSALLITLPITTPAGFTVTVEPATSIVPGDSTTFTLRADAGSEAAFSGNVSIVSNAASSPTPIPVEVNVINAIFANLTRAWPLSENTANVMMRDALSSGDDFMPVFSGGFTNGHPNLDGTDDYLVCGRSNAMQIGSDTAFTFSVKVKPTSTTGTKWIASFANTSDNSLQSFFIFHSGATVSLRVGNGAGGGEGVGFRTISRAASLSVGVETIITVGHDPVNNLISLKIGTNAIVTGAWSLGTYADVGGLWLGAVPTRAVGTFFAGEIYDVLYWNGTYLTDAEQTTLAGKAFPYPALANQSYSLDPDDASYTKYSKKDFGDLSTMWQNAAKTTPVAANNDPIRVITDLWNTHDWAAAADGERPILLANTLNGYAVGDWDGVDDNLDFDETWPDTDFTLVFVCKNNDATDGSHVLAPGNYLAITGASYVSGTYAVIHPVNNSPAAQSNLVNAAGYNIIEVTYNTTTDEFRIVSHGGQLGRVTNNSGFAPNRMGDWNATNSNWQMDAEMALIFRFNQLATIADKMRMRKFLETKYALTNVAYRGV